MPDEWLAMLLDILASSFYLGVIQSWWRSSIRWRATCCLSWRKWGFPTSISVVRARIPMTGASFARVLAIPRLTGISGCWRGAKSISGDPHVSVGFGLCYGAPDQTIDDLARQIDQTLACGPQRILVQDMTPRRRNALDRSGEGAIADIEQPMLKLVAARLRRLVTHESPKDYYALRGDAFGRSAAPWTTRNASLWPLDCGGLDDRCAGARRHRRGRARVLPRTTYPAKTTSQHLRQRRLLGDAWHLPGRRRPLRRAVVHSLSSNFFVDVEALSLAHCVDFYRHFSAERPMLDALSMPG